MELEVALQQTNIIVLDVETKKTETWTGKGLLGVAIGIPRGLDVTPYYILPADLHRYKSRTVRRRNHASERLPSRR